MFGYSLYEAKAGLNSLTLLNHGNKFEYCDREEDYLIRELEDNLYIFVGTLFGYIFRDNET